MIPLPQFAEQQEIIVEHRYRTGFISVAVTGKVDVRKEVAT
jgi:hypothetical protein